MLKQLRKVWNTESYDAVINKLIAKQTNIEKMHGILGNRGMKWVMEDLRDKSDRF